MAGGGDGALVPLKATPGEASKSTASVPQDAVTPPATDTMPSWVHKLAGCPDDITNMWTIIHLGFGCDFQTACSTIDMGHHLTGSEDGAWDNLREINMYIQGAVNTLSSYLSGLPFAPIRESFAYAKFGGPLMLLLGPTCERAFGEQAAGKLLAVKRALVDLYEGCLHEKCQHPDWPVKADPSKPHDMLIESFLRFVTVTGALWTELTCHTSVKTCQCPTVALVSRVRQAAKFETACRIFESLPEQLSKHAAGTLTGLLEDTLEVYDLAVELWAHKEEAGLPMEETLGYVAFAKFYEAAKTLANTSLAKLKEEGLETGFNEEEWDVAAKEGLAIYMRGEPLALTLPPDLLQRMLDYVIHVMVTLALLVKCPDAETGWPFLGNRRSQRAGSGENFPQKKAGGAFSPSLMASSASAPKGSSDCATMPWLKERWAVAAKAREEAEAEALAKIRGRGRPDKGQDATPDGRAATSSGAQGNWPAEAWDAPPFNAEGGPAPTVGDTQIYFIVDGRLTLNRRALENAMNKCIADATSPEDMRKLVFKCLGDPSVTVEWLNKRTAEFFEAYRARAQALDVSGRDKGHAPAISTGNVSNGDVSNGDVAAPSAAQGNGPAQPADASASKSAARTEAKGHGLRA